MPRKFTLSPAKVSAFLTCRKLYVNNYIARLNRFYYRPNVGDTFGGSLHRALDRYHKGGDRSAEALSEHLKDTWASKGFESKAEEREYLERAEQIFSAYAAKNAEANTLFTEKTLTADMGDYKLTGRIDRIDEIGPGSLRLIDYKSGRLTVTEEELRGNIAMRIYHLLATNILDCERAETGIYCLQTGDEAYVDFTPEETKETVDILNGVAEEAMSLTPESKISYIFGAPHCSGCIYFENCRKNFMKTRKNH